jgi:hypothetical protein
MESTIPRPARFQVPPRVLAGSGMTPVFPTAASKSNLCALIDFFQDLDPAHFHDSVCLQLGPWSRRHHNHYRTARCVRLKLRRIRTASRNSQSPLDRKGAGVLRANFSPCVRTAPARSGVFPQPVPNGSIQPIAIEVLLQGLPSSKCVQLLERTLKPASVHCDTLPGRCQVVRLFSITTFFT